MTVWSPKEAKTNRTTQPAETGNQRNPRPDDEGYNYYSGHAFALNMIFFFVCMPRPNDPKRDSAQLLRHNAGTCDANNFVTKCRVNGTDEADVVHTGCGQISYTRKGSFFLRLAQGKGNSFDGQFWLGIGHRQASSIHSQQQMVFEQQFGFT